MDLKNKIALVTGGNSGLGYEVTRQLVQAGCRVLVLGKDKSKVETAVKKLSSPLASPLICDLRDYPAITKTVGGLGQIDILINCAGLIAYQPLDAHDPQNIKDIIDVNLLGTIFVTREVFAKMKRKNYGTIINISSTSGLPTGGHTNESVYMASKFGVAGFTQGLKKEVSAEKINIKVIGFYPGGMATDLFAKAGAGIDSADFMDPVEIAKIVVFILQRPDTINIDHIVINRNKST